MVKSALLNNWHMHQKKEKPVRKTLQQDRYWEKEIEETMKFGYSYEVAYAIVSKRKIQELFDKDIKINHGK